MMRAFIGVGIPWEVKNKIIAVQNILREKSTRGRWKYIDNFHLTLKFLGEVSDDTVDKIYENMEANLNDIKRIDLKIKELGFFKGDGCFRVIYFKVSDCSGMLKRAYFGIEKSCCLAGIPKEKRPYTPHITIAQDVVLPYGFDFIKEKASCLDGTDISVGRISIIKSEQINGKRIYTPIKTLSFK